MVHPHHSMRAYLAASAVVNWQHPKVMALAQQLAVGQESIMAVARACFEWVRDEIDHSVDYQKNPVTCCAADVLEYRTGYCFAKSHLLAALLRANQIPTGFCYQRLSLDDRGAPYCLHGFNGVYLPATGWYRVDARGNKAGINAQFTPPIERLAYQPRLSEERDFRNILAAPLPMVVTTLRTQTTWDAMLRHLPDIDLASANAHGLSP
jgi:transglutaminase-like putative cysteine protease